MDYELLQRYIEGRVTAKEAEQVVDWLDADEAHVKEFMALHKAFDISVMNQSAAQTLRKRAKQIKLRQTLWKRAKQIKLRSIGVELVKIAAVILLVLGIQYGWEFRQSEQDQEERPLYQTLYVPWGFNTDGSSDSQNKIWKNDPCTKLYMYQLGNEQN